MRDLFGKVGQTVSFIFAGTGRLFGLLGESFSLMGRGLYQRKLINRKTVFNQMVMAGIDSLPIICLTAFAVGTVLALQAAYQLKEFGAVMYTGSLVAVSVTRELGPLIAAIILSGRIGARFAAELGTMKVSEEVDALKTMGLNPIAFLVVPRVLALLTMLPALTIVTDVVAIFGGFLIGTFGIGINPHLYMANSWKAMVLKDLYSGFAKSFIFSLVIAIVSCHQGLSVSGGAEGVGKATTQAVVTSVVLIIVVDCLATAIMYYALPA